MRFFIKEQLAAFNKELKDKKDKYNWIQTIQL